MINIQQERLLKKLLISFIAPLAMLISACDSHPQTDTGYLNLENIEVEGDSVKKSFIVNASDNCEWIITWTDSWIKQVTPQKGRGKQTVSLDLEVNSSSTATRTAILRVESTNMSNVIPPKTMTVSQAPSKPFLTISPNYIDFESTGGTKSVRVESNITWNVSGIEGFEDKITLNVHEGTGNGNIVITLGENKERNDFQTTLHFYGTSVSQELTIRQYASEPQLMVSHDSISFGEGGGRSTFRITSNVNWAINSNEAWCSVTQPKGTGNGDVEIVAEPNILFEQRKATVTINGDGLQHVLYITQEPLTPVLSINPNNTSFDFSSSGGCVTLEVNANEAWTAETNQTWCEVDKASNSGESTLTITISKSEQTTERTATVLLKTSHLSVTITIHQQGRNSPNDGDNSTPNIP